MAESLEKFLIDQGNKYGMDINQTIDLHKEFVHMKKVCLQVYNEKDMGIDQNIYNCLEKVKQSIRLYEKTVNKIY
jgi:hypothetical protein